MKKHYITNSDSLLIMASDSKQQTNLLTCLIDDISENLTKLDEALNSKEIEKIDYYLHKFLGVSGMFGLENLHYTVNDCINNKSNSYIKKSKYQHLIFSAFKTKILLTKLLPTA